MNWTEAVSLAREGKDQGYDFLYRKTYQKNYYVALQYMKQEDAAQDVLQDAYCKAFRNLEQLQDAEKFPGWMARIVATTALDELKKRKVVLFSQIQGGDDEISMEEILEDERTDTQPELAIDQKETQRLVQEMIAALSDEQRICIMMYYVEQLSVKEIAQTLNVSENTVKSRLNYGRKNIEQKTLKLEKKGTKLYGLAPFTFFLYLLRKDVMSVQAAEVPFRDTISEENTTLTGGKAGRSVLFKASAISVKKAVIGTVLGLAVCGGAAAGIYSGISHPDKVEETGDLLKEDAQQVPESLPEEHGNTSAVEEVTETEVQETEATELETETQVTEAEDEKWQDAYIAFTNGLQADDNGYAVLEVTGSDAPVLVVMPDLFYQTTDAAGADSCTHTGYFFNQLYYFDTATDEVKRITGAESDSPDGALVDVYMDIGYYLSYMPDEKLLVGDLVGSSAVIETYSVDIQTDNLHGEEKYVDEAVETVPRKDIIYYQSIEQALENIGAVQE